MIQIINAEEHLDLFQSLLNEYTESIAAKDENVTLTLSAQHLEEERRNLRRKYGTPDRRMYVALVDGNLTGCVALTKNDTEYCEIKRLYIRPAYRGLHLGRILCERIISDAKSIGYRYMRLDTFPFMKNAIRLYENEGFVRIPKYNNNPADNAVFMQLTL